MSIRSKLILAVGIPLVVIYLCALAFDYAVGKEDALRQMKSHLTELAAHHAAQLNGHFEKVAQVARTTATFLETRPDMTADDLYALLRNTVKDNSDVFGACIAFEPYAFSKTRARFAPYVCRTGEGLRSLDIGAESYDYLRWDWYLVPRLLHRPIWSDPYYDVGAGNAIMCTYSVPFKAKGRLRGIATVDISLESLREEVAATKMAKGYSLIVGPNGVFISHPQRSFIMKETVFSLAEWYNLPQLADLGRAMTSGRSGVMLIPDFRTGAPKWCVFAPIVASGWSFAAVIPEELVMAPLYAELRWKTGIMGLGLVLIVLLIVFSAFRITQPIALLDKAVREVASGNLDVQATGIHTRDEIGEFAEAFNRMVSDLKAHVEALTRETSAREAVESELRIARSIQASLLPRVFPPFPERTEFELHAVNVPAKQVAGDFFDFYFISDDQLLFVIADVSGKGVPAALFMAVTRTLLKNLAMSDLGPAEILQRANDVLVEDNDEYMFVTLFLGLYDTRTGRLRFANAGHNPPYHLDRRGEILEVLKATGAVLGVIEEQTFEERETELAPGDLLFLYTDGVTEAHSPDDEFYGEKALEELLRARSGEPCERLCDAIVETVDEFQAGDQYDDITLLALRRTP